MLAQKQLGRRIKQLRKSKKITQEKLAEMIDVDFGYISKIEVGLNFPSIRTLNKIAEALDVDIADFFTNLDCLIPPKDLQAEITNIIANFSAEKKTYVYKFVKSLEV